MSFPVFPYKRHPATPTVCVVEPDGSCTTEHGDLVDLDRMPPNHRAWCSYDTARELLLDGHGEALRWNNEEIRWRHRVHEDEDGWVNRSSDVYVLKAPFPPETERTLDALGRWRDWLGRYNAAPTGTTGSAAWSLLRATIFEPLWLSQGAVPPLLQTLGGRQELGPRGPGRYSGRIEHLDLPAAYASEIGGLCYGGHWLHSSQLPTRATDPEWWSRSHAVFVRAHVTVPDSLQYGPLPRRSRGRVYGVKALLLGAYYPTGTRLQGVWTWQELEAAVGVGCKVRVLEHWAHLAGDTKPFAYWWQAVQDGREMDGLAGLLAKMTGNALWGRFCMDRHAPGGRTITRRPRGRGVLVSRRLPFVGGVPPAHDLAETVSGRVRARLYGLMREAGPSLVCAHTDGAWVEAPGFGQRVESIPAGWRLKDTARQLDVLNPQTLRYWPARPADSAPWTVYAGMPATLAGEAFEVAWAEAQGRGEVAA